MSQAPPNTPPNAAVTYVTNGDRTYRLLKGSFQDGCVAVEDCVTGEVVLVHLSDRGWSAAPGAPRTGADARPDPPL